MQGYSPTLEIIHVREEETPTYRGSGEGVEGTEVTEVTEERLWET